MVATFVSTSSTWVAVFIEVLASRYSFQRCRSAGATPEICEQVLHRPLSVFGRHLVAQAATAKGRARYNRERGTIWTKTWE
jgi:hypothetical protein